MLDSDEKNGLSVTVNRLTSVKWSLIKWALHLHDAALMSIKCCLSTLAIRSRICTQLSQHLLIKKITGFPRNGSSGVTKVVLNFLGVSSEVRESSWTLINYGSFSGKYVPKAGVEKTTHLVPTCINGVFIQNRHKERQGHSPKLDSTAIKSVIGTRVKHKFKKV